MDNKENEYEDLLGPSNLIEEDEDEKRLIEAMKKQMPGYKREHQPLVISKKGQALLMMLWEVVKVVAIFLTVLFIVPFAINISVPLINALAGTVSLYILKFWWKGK